jgi:hypothetical protein
MYCSFHTAICVSEQGLSSSSKSLRSPSGARRRGAGERRVGSRNGPTRKRVGKEWRFSRTMLTEWVASGPDRHDLELYDREARENTEQGLDQEEQPG